ncbi:carbohydrate kinase family protein [Hoeflea alexandrii]|uniref:carbohydrate kinase family protein n=1 Tax=Hoeflea alexandrii TaxID=288436 RepID=UPI0022AE6996|nr:carbohydrate kinase family protein [Hoeflea alexandrii]MCZ4291494.1 carbohydrate kinase family protein [Hoeflea alexandrii]
MNRLVVTGYASLDFAVGLDGHALGDTTTLIAARDPLAWPRAGGCPTYISGAAVRAGQQAIPVMWVGKGPEGEGFVAKLEAQGIGTGGIGIVDSPRSPTALLVYQSDGSCMCLYDPALGRAETLSQEQKDLIASASHLCVSVGPHQLMDEIVALCPAQARLYWAVKNDPDAFPPDLRRQLAKRADVIFHSASERSLIGETGAVLVETRGSECVIVTAAGQAQELRVEPIEITDTTGAGDSFAGGYIAAEMTGADPVTAARAGIKAAAALLADRKRRHSS